MTQNSRRTRTSPLWALALLLLARFATAQAVATSDVTPFHEDSTHLPWEIGVLTQGGFGLTEDRDDFKFFMAGVHAGKVLTHHSRPHPPSAATSSTPSRSSPSGSPTPPNSSAPFCTNPPGAPPACTASLHRRRHLHRSLHHPHHPSMEHRRHPSLLLLGTRRRRCPLDQSQIPRLRWPTLQRTKRRPQRRRQRLELHPTRRSRRPLLPPPPPLHRLRSQRHPHLQRLARRPQPRRQRQRTILPRIHLVEVNQSLPVANPAICNPLTR